MNDPSWFRPGVRVRLKPGVRASLPDYPAEATLQPNPHFAHKSGYCPGALFYPRGDGKVAYVRPEHLEPVGDVIEVAVAPYTPGTEPPEVTDDKGGTWKFREFL